MAAAEISLSAALSGSRPHLNHRATSRLYSLVACSIAMRAMTGSGDALLNSFKISAMLMGNPPWGKNLPADYPNSLTLANTRDSFKTLPLAVAAVKYEGNVRSGGGRLGFNSPEGSAEFVRELLLT